MELKVILVVAFIGLVSAQDLYENYNVYQVTPKDEAQMKVLLTFKGQSGFDFWSTPRAINMPISVMVNPQNQNIFTSTLNTNEISYKLLIDNVEKTIQHENERQLRAKKDLNGDVSFLKFMTIDEILSYLDTLAEKFPTLVTKEVIGKTIENRDVALLKISKGGSNNPAIFVDAGIHAREWIAPPVALYIIQQLVQNSTNYPMFDNVDWYILPSLNPDGYAYTHSKERLWRKNRSPGSLCYGTDCNRNFDFHWMETGASDFECSETFAGKKGFSELETKALSDYMLQHKDSIKLYLTFHSYGQYLLYPWGYTSDLPDDWKELDDLAKSVNTAISSVAGTKYTIGSSTNVLYAAAGGSDDWAKGVAGVALSYTIELPGGGSAGFNPPATSILPIVQETWEGIKVYHKYIEDKFVN